MCGIEKKVRIRTIVSGRSCEKAEFCERQEGCREYGSEVFRIPEEVKGRKISLSVFLIAGRYPGRMDSGKSITGGGAGNF
jgi:hypothetical protein